MDEMAKLYNEGYSSWEIASKFNVLNVCVLKILRKNIEIIKGLILSKIRNVKNM